MIPLLEGMRGAPAGDIGALAETTCRFSRLSMEASDDTWEIDINPVVFWKKGKGVIALDCLMTQRDRRED